MSYPSYDENSFDFDEIADLYQSLGALNPPAELQGLWCGRLVGGARWSDQDVLDSVLDHMGVERLEEEEDQALILRVYRRVESSLQKDDLTFSLLLPPENYPLDERVMALGQWARGFLEGLALERGAELISDDEDNQELLSDLVEISRIELESDDEEASEMQLIEVTEHVRIAVLHLYHDFGPEFSGSANPTPTIH